MIQTLVLATHNAGKKKEFDTLLNGLVGEVKSAADLNLPEPEETGVTFAENAVLKAVAAMTETGLPALADDSGLAVESLNGDPGIYSARWAGPDKDFTGAMEKINTLLGEEERNASFVCVLALAYPDGKIVTFDGHCHGTLVWPPRGLDGFGYDPMFLPEGRGETFGEMSSDDKHAISHRRMAVDKLVQHLKGD